MSKPAATLTSSLLALKGRASTAGFTPPPELPVSPLATPPVAMPATSTAGAAEPLLAEPLLKARPPRGDAPRKGTNGAGRPRNAMAGSGGSGGSGVPAVETVRLSYRMAPAEHRRFALLAAHLGKSKQQLLDEALAAFMARCGSEVAGGACACLGGAAEGDRGDAGLALARQQPGPAAKGPLLAAAAGEQE